MLVEMDVDQTEGIQISERGVECFFQIAFGQHFKAPAGTQKLGHLMIIPVVNIVERAFLNKTFRRIALIVQHDDDRIESHPNGRGQFHARHLERPIADEH